MIISGTGSRSLITDKLQYDKVYNKVLSRLSEINKTEKISAVISGMAEGFDEALAKAAMELNLQLICAIPNKGYLKYYWGEHSLLQYDRYAEAGKICTYAQLNGKIHYVCNSIYDSDGKHANFTRNEYMVKNCNYMFVYDPTSRGTSHCYNLIKENNLKHEIIEV